MEIKESNRAKAECRWHSGTRGARKREKGAAGFPEPDNPIIMMFAVLTYANMRGIRAVDRIVDLCERDIAFIWLTKGLKPKRDAFYEFKNNKLDDEVLDDLHYQFIYFL